MTAEICAMNRLAVVLAADSATTVTYYRDGQQEERYFKGANKIFQVSDHHPVGMMIFDSADLLHVPWEVAIKEFRRSLGTKSFNHVEDYANEFFSFIQGNHTMFPAKAQQEAFLAAAQTSIFSLIILPGAGIKDPEQRLAEVQRIITEKKAELSELDFQPCIDKENYNKSLDSNEDTLIQYAISACERMEAPVPDDLKDVISLAVLQVYKKPKIFMNTAGLVFAGFGDHDVFPSMVSFTSCGLLEGKHVHEVGICMNIDHQTPACLVPFAQRDMADTFTLGVGLDIYQLILSSVVDGLANFTDKLAATVGFDPSSVDILPDLIKEARSEIGRGVLHEAEKQHAIPLRMILGVLPVDELADLAETLVNLQSLKEKVTKPSASVGGPVDVAAITRAEGLVWVKRKHYFDSSINSRYMARVNQNHMQ